MYDIYSEENRANFLTDYKNLSITDYRRMRKYLLTEHHDINPAGVHKCDHTYSDFFSRELTTRSWTQSDFLCWCQSSPDRLRIFQDDYLCDGEDLIFMFEHRKKLMREHDTDVIYQGMFKEGADEFDIYVFWDYVSSLIWNDSRHQVTLVCNGFIGILGDLMPSATSTKPKSVDYTLALTVREELSRLDECPRVRRSTRGAGKVMQAYDNSGREYRVSSSSCAVMQKMKIIRFRSKLLNKG